MEDDEEQDHKRRRVQGAGGAAGGAAERLQPSLSRVQAAFETQGAQVQGNFLVVRDVLDPLACQRVLEQLLAIHRPQHLVYEGNGTVGTSYTNSWRISTYAHTSPETYVYQFFSEKYGAPYDQPMRDCMESAGLIALLEALKARFLATLAQDAGLCEAETQQWIDDTQLAQLFLTIQPAKDRMLELDTYMQPHYDPSILTINVHLSALNWNGCPPAENGLRVFGGQYPGGSQVFPTPQGACVFIWQDPATGEGCLHTANDIGKGQRAVLCSFWRRKGAKTKPHGKTGAKVSKPFSDELSASKDLGKSVGGDRRDTVRKGEAEIRRQSVLASMAAGPLPIPVQLCAPQPAQGNIRVPREASMLLRRQGYVTLHLGPLLAGPAASSLARGAVLGGGGRADEFVDVLDVLRKESACLSTSMEWVGNEGCVDLLARSYGAEGCPTQVSMGTHTHRRGDSRRCPLDFRRLRRDLARAREKGGKQGAQEVAAGDGGAGEGEEGEAGGSSNAQADESLAAAAGLLLDTLPPVLHQLVTPETCDMRDGTRAVEDEGVQGVRDQLADLPQDRRNYLYNENFVDVLMRSGAAAQWRFGLRSLCVYGFACACMYACVCACVLQGRSVVKRVFVVAVEGGGHPSTV